MRNKQATASDGDGVRKDDFAVPSDSTMIPIQDLLHRIQWDPEFGKGNFVIGYFDRRLGHIIQVPFQRISLEPGSSFSFELFDEVGRSRMIPLHRVREVWCNGSLIWHRATA